MGAASQAGLQDGLLRLWPRPYDGLPRVARPDSIPAISQRPIDRPDASVDVHSNAGSAAEDEAMTEVEAFPQRKWMRLGARESRQIG